jgi:hypothetical protein
MRLISKSAIRFLLPGLVMLPFPGLATVASAATTTGSMAVTGTLAGSISVTVIPPPLTLGSVGKYDAGLAGGGGSNGYLYTVGTTSWSMATPVSVTATSYNSPSASYSLTASLSSNPPSGVTLSINSITLSSTATSLTTTGVYGTTYQWTWLIAITDAASTGAIGRTVTFVATSN